MKRLVLIADNIRSTHNVGAFFRTCDAFEASIILTGITPRPSGGENDDRLPHIREKMDKAIDKTALGATSTVSWKYYQTTEEAISSLKEQGYTVAALEQHPTSRNIAELNADKVQPLAIIAGPEVTGIDSKTLQLVDEIYEIPMKGDKESLNVSVAAAIALYQATPK